MRFALAVLAGALVLGVAFLRLPSVNNPMLSMIVVVLAAFGTGFFAVRRGALAGFVIVYLGNLLFVLVNLVQLGVPEQDPSGMPGFIARLLVVQFVLLQFAIPAAVAGWLGAHARARLGPRWR